MFYFFSLFQIEDDADDVDVLSSLKPEKADEVVGDLDHDEL